MRRPQALSRGRLGILDAGQEVGSVSHCLDWPENRIECDSSGPQFGYFSVCPLAVEILTGSALGVRD